MRWKKLAVFFKRNPELSIRMPTATNIDRVKTFKKQAVGHFLPFIKRYWIHTEV